VATAALVISGWLFVLALAYLSHDKAAVATCGGLPGSRRRVSRPTPDRALPIRDNFSLHHLNCGITGALMRGGAARYPWRRCRPARIDRHISHAPRVAALVGPLLPLLKVPFRPHLRLAQMKRQVWPRHEQCYSDFYRGVDMG